jgi:hypothetical protein
MRPEIIVMLEKILARDYGGMLVGQRTGVRRWGMW